MEVSHRTTHIQHGPPTDPHHGGVIGARWNSQDPAKGTPNPDIPLMERDDLYQEEEGAGGAGAVGGTRGEVPFEGGTEDAGGDEAGAAGDEAPGQNGGGPSPTRREVHPILTSAREAHCQRERERPPASVPCGAYIPFLGLDPAQSADYEDGLMVPVGGDELDEDGDEVGDAYGQSPKRFSEPYKGP